MSVFLLNRQGRRDLPHREGGCGRTAPVFPVVNRENVVFFVIIVQILVSICQNLSDYYKGLLKSSV